MRLLPLANSHFHPTSFHGSNNQKENRERLKTEKNSPEIFTDSYGYAIVYGEITKEEAFACFDDSHTLGR